jgi:hypothetical protein
MIAAGRAMPERARNADLDYSVFAIFAIISSSRRLDITPDERLA